MEFKKIAKKKRIATLFMKIKSLFDYILRGQFFIYMIELEINTDFVI